MPHMKVMEMKKFQVQNRKTLKKNLKTHPTMMMRVAVVTPRIYILRHRVDLAEEKKDE